MSTKFDARLAASRKG